MDFQNSTIIIEFFCLEGSSRGMGCARFQMGRVTSAVSGLCDARPTCSLNRCCSLKEASDINGR